MHRYLAMLLILCLLPGVCLGEAARYAEVATEKGTLNMRSQDRDDAKIIAKLARGSIVQVISDDEVWTRVRYGGQEGYVMNKFLRAITALPYQTITKEDQGTDAVLNFKRALHKLEYIKSDDINMRFDDVLTNALLRMQLMNGVTLSPDAVTPELQALIEWGMIKKGKTGYVDVATDAATGLTVGIFCWDSAGVLYEKDAAVKLTISYGVQATGGVPPYDITVKKSLGGEASGDVVENPFSHIWGQTSERLYVYATVVDAQGNTVTACAPFAYRLPARYVPVG